MYKIWVRIGDYGTPIPFVALGKIFLSKDDLIIRHSLYFYISELKKLKLKIKQPMEVTVQEIKNKEVQKEKKFKFKTREVQ